MSEQVPGQSPARRFPWLVVLSLVAVVVLFAVSFVVGGRVAADGGEGFAGTDSAVVDILDEQGAQPWFAPVFEPGSGELESGLFALQAAVGAGIVGYAFGNLRGRKAARDAAAKAQHMAPGAG